ncbi:MAG TPA: GTP-binding protein [Salinibacter sp.]|nr:GTP-binding protein [Salinibacter sp.]
MDSGDFEQVSEEERTPSVKIIVIGPVGSGKTSIVRRFVHDHFMQNYKATIGVDFCRKNAYLPESNHKVDLNFWDLAGDDRFNSVSSIYYRNAVGVFVVFDVTRPSTVQGALKWYHQLDERYEEEDRPPVVFLANKIDLKRQTNYEEIAGLVDAPGTPLAEKKVGGVIETSAKDDVDIDKAVQLMLALVEARMPSEALAAKSSPVLELRQKRALSDSCCS